MIVTIGNTKGGVGKSTLALNFAVLRARAGRDVWLVNADKQQSAEKAVAERVKTGAPVMFACAQYDDAHALHAQVQRQAKKYDDVIIDAGGRDTRSFRAALVASDVVLVPWAPRSVELWELETMAQLLAECQAIKPKLRVLACINMADATGPDNQAAAEAIAGFLGDCLPELVVRRKRISDAMGFGLAAAELAPKDPKAIAELDALCRAVFADTGTMPADYPQETSK